MAKKCQYRGYFWDFHATEKKSKPEALQKKRRLSGCENVN
jgi:hypothetical protein